MKFPRYFRAMGDTGDVPRRTKAVHKKLAPVVAVACGSLLAQACSSTSTSTTKPAATGGKSVSQTPVDVSFWTWAAGYDQIVNAFNSTHKDVHVTLNQISPTSGATQLLSAIKAGNPPCLTAQNYSGVPEFVFEGYVENIAPYVSSLKKEFDSAAWTQVAFGNGVYGIPLETGPMTFMYRKDLYAKYGLAVPKTWQQFAQEAESFHASNPGKYLVTLPTTYGSDFIEAMAWQNHARWFSTQGNTWHVNIDSPATMAIAKYWQKLLDEHAILAEPLSSPESYKQLDEGSVLSEIQPSWYAGRMKREAAPTAGQWGMALLPQWDPNSPSSAQDGGSAVIELKGCSHPKQAAEFAAWLGTDATSTTDIFTNIHSYPADLKDQQLPALAQPDPFFGGQVTTKVMAQSMADSPAWTWGPLMQQVANTLNSDLGKVGAGQMTLTQAVSDTQSSTVAAMKQAGLSVTQG